MTRWLGGAAIAVLAWSLAGAAPARGNGATQREIQGRIVAVDPGRGTLVVQQEFRGRTTRVELRAAPDLRAFACSGGPRAGLDRLRTGMAVSVFYEVAGQDGLANLIVIEPDR